MKSKNPSLFIEDLPQHSREILQRDVKHLSFSEGEIITRKGQTVSGVYIVKKGAMSIFVFDPNCNEKVIYKLDEGEPCVFSINSILQQVVYPAWSKADSKNTEVLYISASTFLHLYENELLIRDFVLGSLSQRVVDLISVIDETMSLDIGTRINRFLVRSCCDNGFINISHKDIAARLGTAREVVSRHLKCLEKSGCIKLARMKIQIISPQTLANIPSNTPVE